MDLWIRSQDKLKLLKISCFYVKHNHVNDDCDIIGDDEWILGSYLSEEKVIEVLDEIQDVMDHLLDSDLSISGYVYEMPKE